jgi:hypothetical protein
MITAINNNETAPSSYGKKELEQSMTWKCAM